LIGADGRIRLLAMHLGWAELLIIAIVAGIIWIIAVRRRL
jgi:hypothetical protein